MNSITEFTNADESVIVNRVLLTLHSEIDRFFTDASSSSPKQFRKTVFSDANDSTALNDPDADPTLVNKIPPMLPPTPSPMLASENASSSTSTHLTPVPPPPPRSDLELLEIKDERTKLGNGRAANPPLSSPPSQFPEFSKIEENPVFLYEKRRRLIIILALIMVTASALGYYFFS